MVTWHLRLQKSSDYQNSRAGFLLIWFHVMQDAQANGLAASFKLRQRWTFRTLLSSPSSDIGHSIILSRSELPLAILSSFALFLESKLLTVGWSIFFRWLMRVYSLVQKCLHPIGLETAKKEQLVWSDPSHQSCPFSRIFYPCLCWCGGDHWWYGHSPFLISGAVL